MNIICLDTETTGLNHYDDEILQLSIIDGSGSILFSEYVKPVRHECWTDAEKVNHISPSMVYREEYVEEYMLNHIRPALSDYVAKYEVTAASAVQKNPVEEMSKIERKIKKLYDLFMDDLIDKDAYRSEYDKFKKQIEELQKCPAAPVRNLDSVRKLLNDDWEAVYNTFSNQEKNVFWKSFVESVLVYEDGSMDIHFL